MFVMCDVVISTTLFCSPLHCCFIVLQPWISLQHGVRCCQEGHQAGQGECVCVCVLPVNLAYCVPTGAFRLWMWRHCHNLTTNSINTKSCWMFSVGTTEPAQLCVVLLQRCEANRTCQLVVSKCCRRLSLILTMQHINCNDGSSWPTHTFI